MNKCEIDNMDNQEDISNVLIVDSDTESARRILEVLARKGIRGHLTPDKSRANDFIGKNRCDLVFLSDCISEHSETSGHSHDNFELLEALKKSQPELPVVMMTRNVEQKQNSLCRIIDTTVKAVRRGCCDFVVKPLDLGKIENLLDTCLPSHKVSTIASAYENTDCLYRIVGRSTSLARTVDLAKRVAPTSAAVLISGESGTGKELLAYLIHRKSKRAQNAYIKVNCAALSDTLLESELFGHEKGAFTGAYTQRKGRFEMAHGGTLLLDEITETPLKFQAKLLRVLEQQDFERVGGNDSIRVDVRIISTTNKDLLQEVEKGRFRQDLYYRLSGVRLVVSPLRERVDDLYDLVWYFVNLYAREVHRKIIKLDPVMINILSKYHWPGNVRQLRNVVRTSLILGVGPVLSLADVSWLFDELQPLTQGYYRDNDSRDLDQSSLRESSTSVTNNMRHNTGLGGVSLEKIERRAILDTLSQTGGNQTKAAKVLGISDRTLRDRIQRYKKEGCLQPA